MKMIPEFSSEKFLSSVLKPFEFILFITASYPGREFTLCSFRISSVIWALWAAFIWSGLLTLVVFTTLYKIRTSSGTVPEMVDSACFSLSFVSQPVMTFIIATRFGRLTSLVEKSMPIFDRYLWQRKSRNVIAVIVIAFLTVGVIIPSVSAYAETRPHGVGMDIAMEISKLTMLDLITTSRLMSILEILGEFSIWGSATALAFLAVIALLCGLCVGQVTAQFAGADMQNQPGFVSNVVREYRVIGRIVEEIDDLMGLFLLVGYSYEIVALVYNVSFLRGNIVMVVGGAAGIAFFAVQTACFVYLSDKVQCFMTAFSRLLQDGEPIRKTKLYLQLLTNMQANPAVFSLGACVNLNRQTVVSMLGLLLTYVLLASEKSGRSGNPKTMNRISENRSICACSGTYFQ